MNLPASFSENQYQYFQRTFDSWFNVAEGGKRGGKNVVNALSFACNLETHPDKLHLVAGIDVSAAKLNVIDCNGYGLTNFFHGRCREGRYKDMNALFVSTHTGEKIVLVAGLGNIRSQDDIAGQSYGMVYVTEAIRCHPAGVQEATDRTMASKNRKVFHDSNPRAAGHPYYSNVLDFHEKKQSENPTYGYNYGHFTIADNLSMTQEDVNAVINTYDKESPWYQRDILGKRKQLEGLVYQIFNPDYHVVRTEPRPYTKYYISNDYGTKHPCVFLLFGFHNDTWYLIKEVFHHGEKERQKTVGEYYTDLYNLAGNLKIENLILDNAPIASSFNIHVQHERRFLTRKAQDDVLPGIQEVTTALSTGKLKINDCCKHTIREFGLYRWKENSVKDEPVMENDDCLAALRYFVKTIRIVRPPTSFIFA